MRYYVFTDGACKCRYFGGYAGVIYNDEEQSLEEFAGYAVNTSNNRMELQAVITALSKLPLRADIYLFADSSYVINAFNKGWITKWKAKDYHRRPNADLWKKLDRLVRARRVTFIWVKGHSHNVFNTRCDILANSAAEQVMITIPYKLMLEPHENDMVLRDILNTVKTYKHE